MIPTLELPCQTTIEKTPLPTRIQLNLGHAGDGDLDVPMTPASPVSPGATPDPADLPHRLASPGQYGASLQTPPPEAIIPAKEAVVWVPNPLHPQALAYARTRFGKVIVGGKGLKMEEIHGIINRANPVAGDIILRAPQLLGIYVVGVGYDSIDIETCRDRSVVILNCPATNAPAVAELTLALTLSLLRRIPDLDRKLRSGQTLLSINHLGRSLAGKTVGMVGMGATARKSAELFHHAFGCPIHIYSPTSPSTKWTSHDPAGILPHKRHQTLSGMLPLIDILTLHCPLTPQTRNRISTDQLGLMKPGAILINMSRGAVVDESALAHALSHGIIAGAASDVFKDEPVSNRNCEGLLDLDNFVGTPHIGSTVEAQIDVCFQAIDGLADLFDGRPVHNRVC